MRWARKMLPVCLLLAAGCLPGSLSQEARTGEPRKPFFERVRRLEEQFRRFQEVTLRHLQGIAGNYNISYNIDTRFRHLAAQHDTVTAALNASHAALQEDLGPMKTWMKKLQKRTKKLASKLSSLAGSLGDSRKQSSGERLQQSALLSNLTLQTAGHTAELAALRASSNTLQSQLESLQEASRSQGTQMEVLEQRLKHMLHKEALASGHQKLATAQELNQTPQDKQPEAGGSQGPGVKLKAKRRQRKKLLAQQLLAQAANRGLQSSLARGSQTPGPETPTMPEPQAARPPPRSTTQISYEPLWPPAPENLGTPPGAGSLLFLRHLQGSVNSSSSSCLISLRPPALGLQRGFHAAFPQRLHGELRRLRPGLPDRPARAVGLRLGEHPRSLPGHHPLLRHGGERQQAGPARPEHGPPGGHPLRHRRPGLPGAAGRAAAGRPMAPRVCHLVLPPGQVLVLRGQETGGSGLPLPGGLRDPPRRVAHSGSGAGHGGGRL
ncbi:pentraxin-4 isoform X2 [Pelodiscus sinensis]|uniref:pentraxin-4 isoform X2 n=1 Tax=Pelodiscus sinensis TaxID=13735 RepID=UPI003F6CE8D3